MTPSWICIFGFAAEKRSSVAVALKAEMKER